MTLYIVEVKLPEDKRFRPVIGQELCFERDAAERQAQRYRAGSSNGTFRVVPYVPRKTR